MTYLITTKMLSGQTGYYCGAKSHDYLGSVPYMIYRWSAAEYATRDEAEAAARNRPYSLYTGKQTPIEIIEEAAA